VWEGKDSRFSQHRGLAMSVTPDPIAAELFKG
jgi:hypothetical protein